MMSKITSFALKSTQSPNFTKQHKRMPRKNNQKKNKPPASQLLKDFFLLAAAWVCSGRSVLQLIEDAMAISTKE